MTARRKASFPAIVAALACLAAAGPGRAAPARVVSLNLCADQLLLALADPGQIAALSRFSRDPELSAAAAAAARFPVLRGGVEGLLRLRPDLVLAGPYDRPVTAGMLARQKVPVAIVDLWQGFGHGEAAIDGLAQRLGHPGRGRALVDDIEAARRAVAPLGRGRSVLAVGRGGFVEGEASLVGGLLRAAGLKNLMPDAPFGGFVPLERLLALDPAIVVLTAGGRGDGDRGAGDRGAALLHHPALTRWMAGRRVIALPAALTACPGPGLAAALRRLGAALAE